MNINDCIRFANENPVSHLATVDGDQARVRTMLFCYADETGFYLQTGAMKDLYRQLERNGNVELCFYNQKENRMLRVTGRVAFVDDMDIRARILEEREFLHPVFKTADNPDFIVFKIAHGKCHFWTMKTNLKQKEYIEF